MTPVRSGESVDELLSRYNGHWSGLHEKQFADQAVKSLVVRLTHIVHLYRGNGPRKAQDVALALSMCEPLVEQRLQSAEGQLLTIAVQQHCESDLKAARATARSAMLAYPDEPIFANILGNLSKGEHERKGA